MNALNFELILEGEKELLELRDLKNSDDFQKLSRKKKIKVLKRIYNLEYALFKENPFH